MSWTGSRDKAEVWAKMQVECQPIPLELLPDHESRCEQLEWKGALALAQPIPDAGSPEARYEYKLLDEYQLIQECGPLPLPVYVASPDSEWVYDEALCIGLESRAVRAREWLAEEAEDWLVESLAALLRAHDERCVPPVEGAPQR